jgi:hypothetical protein
MDEMTYSERHVYQAPALFIGSFYLILGAWVVFCIVVIETIIDRLGFSAPIGLVMIVFIIFVMCYFSITISYKIEAWDDGRIRLTSPRRTINVQAETIPLVEGPHLPFGFIKFRLERKKAYLFSFPNDKTLKAVLSVIRNANPEIHFKAL